MKMPELAIARVPLSWQLSIPGELLRKNNVLLTHRTF